MTDEADTRVSFDTVFAGGAAWSGISQISTRFFQFAVTVVLARLLVPAEFGLVGMSMIFTSLMSLFMELGLSTAIIQRRELSEPHMVALLVINTVSGVAVALLCVALAGVAAWVFHSPGLTEVLRVTAIGLPLGALGIVHGALLSKQMRFKALAAGGVVSSVVYGVVSVGLALAGAGVWSLVSGSIALAASRTCMLWLVCPWRPHTRPEFRGLRRIMGFGSAVLGSNFLGWLRGNIDYFLVGTFLGAAQLGVYTIAFKVADFPKRNLVSIFNSVALPMFSGIQDERSRLRAGYFSTLRLVALTVLPLLIGVAVTARPFVLAVYGPKWAMSIAPMRLLAVMGVFISLAQVGSTVLYASGRAALQFRLTVLYASLVGGLVLLTVRNGITAVSWAVLCAAVIFFVISQIAVHRATDASTADLWKSVSPALLACVGMSIVAGAVVFAGRSLSPAVVLALAVLLGGITYLVVLRLLGSRELFGMLSQAGGVLIRDMHAVRRGSRPAPAEHEETLEGRARNAAPRGAQEPIVLSDSN